MKGKMGGSGDQVDCGDKSTQSLRDWWHPQDQPPLVPHWVPVVQAFLPPFSPGLQPLVPTLHPRPHTFLMSRSSTSLGCGHPGCNRRGQAQGEQEVLHGCGRGHTSELPGDGKSEAVGLRGLYRRRANPASPGRAPPPPRCASSPMIHPWGHKGAIFQDSTRPSPLDCVTAFHPRPSLEGPLCPGPRPAPDRP